MNKLKLALVIVLLLGTVGLAFYTRKLHHKNRAAVMAQTTVIARELVTHTNSSHLLFPGTLFQHRLSEFLGSPAQVEALRFGDESRPGGEERAASRIYLVNKKGARLALRLRPEGDIAHFRVLGWWVPTEPPPPES